MNYLGRLKEEIKKLGGPVALSKQLDVNRNTIYNWIEKGNIPGDKLIRMAVLGADIGYILMGKRIDQPNDLVLVPRYEVQASAGTGSYVHDEEVTQTFAFRREWLKKKGLQEKYLSIISVQGDSMQPKLYDGDLILLDSSDTEVKSGKAYVVRIDSELLVKYLQRLPGGALQLSSANPDYPPIAVDKNNQVDIVGRVVCSSHEW